MSELLSTLSRALTVPSAPAVGAAVAWGIASIVLSPCHLGTIPLVIGYVNAGSRPSAGRAFLLSGAFALGVLATLAALGAAAALFGTLVGRVGTAPLVVVSILLVASGLWLMDVPPFTRIGLGARARGTGRGAWGALVLGLVSGVALGPCSFAFLAPVLGVAFAAGSRSWVYGLGLMAAFAAGHCGTIAAAGTAGDRLVALLQRKGLATAGLWIKRACGLAVVGAGIVQALRAFGVAV